MDHDGAVLLAVLADVVDVEALRQVEVKLDRRASPFPPERVDPFDVDLRSVERSSTLIDLVIDALLFKRDLELVDGARPRLLVADPLVRPRRQVGLEVVPEDLGHVRGQVDDGCDLVDRLLFRAEDVGIILRESAHAKHAVERARALVAIDRAELRIPDRQIAVRMHVALVDLDVARAVHRLEVVVDFLDRHRGVHVLPVRLEMPARLVDLLGRNMRRVDDLVAALELLLLLELLDLVADHRAARMPKDQAWPDLIIDREEIEVAAQSPVISPLCLFDSSQVIVQFLLVGQAVP